MSTTTIVRPGHTFTKDPNEILVYGMDWTDWLNTGAGISTSTWVITGDDAVLTKDEAAVSGAEASVRLTAGTEGVTYKVENRIVTDETPAQTGERSFNVTIADR